MENDYGDPSRGRSHEFYNLLLPLQKLFPGTLNFDYMARMGVVGKVAMNREFVDLVEATRPTVTLVSLYTDQLEPETIAAIGRWTTTLAYFFDDIWQPRLSARWARTFLFVTTPDPLGVARFARLGVRNAIYSPFGANEDLYVKLDTPRTTAVSFVGLHHPYREWVVRELRRAGIDVEAYGYRWPAGRIPIARMIDVINRSKISLNISNSSHWHPRFLASSPLAGLRMLRAGKHHEMVKARHFEIAMCGGFQLSYEVSWLSDFFDRDTELVTYRSIGELIQLIRYYLEHDSEREAIAERAWERAHREHTASERLSRLVAAVLGHPRRASDVP